MQWTFASITIPWKYIHKNMIHLGKNHCNPNASTKSIILLQDNGGLDYILQSSCYKKLSPQFLLRVRDIFLQLYDFYLIKQTNYLQTNYLTGA